jgi:UMP-CMP kinase
MIGNKINIIFVLGGPCSGKSTLCKKIEKTTNFKHLSIGNLLRQMALDDEDIKTCITKGDLVEPNKVIDKLKSIFNTNNYFNYIIDGFPRDLDNYNYFKKNILENGNEINLLYTIYVECKNNVMKNRMDERNKIKEKSLDKRADDVDDVLLERIKLFRTKTQLVLDKFDEDSKLFIVNGNLEMNEVFEEAMNVVLNHL